MSEKNVFTIYNASAGSGKTYTLVQSYLSIVLGAKSPEIFKRILAITFTNKAVAEMKTRIIDTLTAFSEPAILHEGHPMFEDIGLMLGVSPKVLHEKSKAALNAMVHNYAAFDISTIDGFTHRIIRTFAHDLKLPLNFEVELDQEALLNEAVDSLINKAGTETALTKILVEFAIEKADDDKSWDVSYDLNRIAKLLVSESDLKYLNQLRDKTGEDFETLKVFLKQEIRTAEKTIVTNAKQVLAQITEAGLDHKHFSRSTLPNHFKKASVLDINGLYKNQLETQLETRNGLYSKTLDEDFAVAIDALVPEIELTYKIIKAEVYHLKFLKAFYKTLTPLSILNAIHKELILLKEAQNKMLISEFNTIIGAQIKDQPTPFIYERIGEKFKHYFIDEFQDTSEKQWENLMPLINNTLSVDGGSTLLVGDAKQAIYRWRGGKAEQFIKLFNTSDTPFNVTQHVKALETNYRSYKAVVNFNNGFFKYLSKTVFQEPDYVSLYENAPQKFNKDDQGYVALSFLDIDKADNRDEVFAQATLDRIKTALINGFTLDEITVLVRKKKEGVVLANYLSEQGIPIISSETLLIMNAPEVVFITNVLALLVQPENNELKIEVLDFLNHHYKIRDTHHFFATHIKLSVEALFEALKAFHVHLNPSALLQLPLYDLVESIARAFQLTHSPNAYLQYYLDVVLDFYEKKGSDISAFLVHLAKKKDTLSVISPEGQNAVQIMTVHKSKGLEFPVVIFPFADLDVYQEIEPKEWFRLEAEHYHGFSHTLLNFNSDFENYGAQGAAIYKRHRCEQELDTINLLYVALTRAEEQLYVISKNDAALKEDRRQQKYSGLFINYLNDLGLWEDHKGEYTFGTPKKTAVKTQTTKPVRLQESFISNERATLNVKIVTKSGMLWDTEQQGAIEKGNLIHEIMSHIKTEKDVTPVMTNYLLASIISTQQHNILQELVSQIVHHQDLNPYFSMDYTVYNERDIIMPNGVLVRPDRVVLDEKKDHVVIIDYKTGEENSQHNNQLNTYKNVLESMGYHVKNTFLVYIGDAVSVKRF
jgi:ATP-dependent exoDNAse (exonuclease V) beta subunit